MVPITPCAAPERRPPEAASSRLASDERHHRDPDGRAEQGGAWSPHRRYGSGALETRARGRTATTATAESCRCQGARWSENAEAENLARRQMPIREASAVGALERLSKARAVRVLALVKTIDLFIQVTVEMPGPGRDIGARERPF